MTLEEGWYLMSLSELEAELARLRDPSVPPSGAPHLTVRQALRLRDAGNLPDSAGRSLRLVLHVRNASDLRNLPTRRLDFEPDFHEEPRWRVDGSLPVNVVPLRLGEIRSGDESEWWNEPEVAELESEWLKTGKVAGIRIPDGYRSFVYKTVLSLRAAGHPVTIESLCASLARWLSPQDSEAFRSALERANEWR